MNKTGKACMAMITAFFLGSIVSAVLAAGLDGNGVSLEQYERLFGLDLTNPDNVTLDYDGDGLSNLAEWYKGTDPFKADTDADGWSDLYDDSVSRAHLIFHPLFTDGDFFRYIWPSWMVAAFKTGGEWETSLPAWYVPAGTSGKLCLIVDRSLLTSDPSTGSGQDVVLELEFYDAPHASLFIDLVNDNNETLISSELFSSPSPGSTGLTTGLIDGSGAIVRKAINIPLESYPEAAGIHIRGTGELFVFEGLIFVDRENDGLDASQEKILGNSDLILDSDGDGISDYDEVFVYGTDPAAATTQDRRTVCGATTVVRHDVTQFSFQPMTSDSSKSLTPSPAEIGTKGAFRAARTKSITIPQWVMIRQAGAQSFMAGADYIMSRDVLDGGGMRQTSPAFIMEDSFAQSSAIGFSYGSAVILHAGYQQAEDERLEIWNASAIPAVFNPRLAELTALSYVLSTRSPGVTIEVYKPDGPIYTLADNAAQNPGLNSLVWDGKDADGNVVTPGEWTFRICAVDYQGRVITNETPVTIRQTMPVILAVSDAPDPFCPAADGNAAIFYTTADFQNKNLDVTIAVEDAFGNPVANFSFPDQAPGSYSCDWDGSGAERNGLYIYRINAKRSQGGGQAANEKTGSIILACGAEAVTNQEGNITVYYQPDGFSIVITNPAPAQVSAAAHALLTAEPGLLFQGGIYDIKAVPPTSFDPPAILIFNYDPDINGDIDAKLQIRRYDETAAAWTVVSPQFVDYANCRIIAEVTNFSLYALIAVEQPPVLAATVRIEPETLNVNPGILTAFVSLPEGYDPVYITDAACDGANYERMMLSNDGSQMIIKFRRQAIEDALAEIGEEIDTSFIVRGTYSDENGTLIFEGTDEISKIARK